MSILNKLAFFQERNDDEPNIALAKELSQTGNKNDIKELIENLSNKEKRIQSNCIKALYELGYIKPELISNYIEDFIKLLNSKNNRLVWGGMIAISTISELKPDEIWKNIDIIIKTMEEGSVITKDAGLIILSKVALKKDEYNKKLFPILIDYLKKSNSKDVASYAEKIAIAINENSKKEFINLLELREKELTDSQLKRVKKILKNL
jgi:hypothetical protein